jgi:peptide subunit release factor 1 (eRF1)
MQLASQEHDSAIERLSAFEPGSHWITSCYLPLTPDSRFRAAYLVDLKNRIRVAREGLAKETIAEAARDAIDRDLDRIVAAVDDSAKLPGAPGVGIFACEGLDLFLVLPLPRVRRARLIVDRIPHLRELRAAQYEFGRMLTALVDRGRARFFEVGPQGAVELPGSPLEVTRGGKFHGDPEGSPGWGEKEFHHRLEHEREQRYEAVSRHLVELERQRPVRGIVIAGPDREVAGLVRFLDAGLRKRLIGTARLNPTSATAAEVLNTTYAVSEENLRTSERSEVAELLEGIGTGWAVNGVQATMRALERGQLRTLFVRADTDVAEAEQAIEDAFAHDVRVIMVHDADAATQVAHLGGFLRFK